jgi:hypothetical protein
MVTSAWRDASRRWSEYRSAPKGSPTKALLLTSAQDGEAFWQDLREERERREEMLDGVEVLSADRYAVLTDDRS